jgi:hypothetical protein
MIYAVNYDLKAPGRDYAGLYDAIKGCGEWWHYLGSTWLVDTRLNADAVWQRLAPHVDENDYMLVIGVTACWQGWLPEDAWKWIRGRIAATAG